MRAGCATDEAMNDEAQVCIFSPEPRTAQARKLFHTLLASSIEIPDVPALAKAARSKKIFTARPDVSFRRKA